jgi:hypothetical protein
MSDEETANAITTFYTENGNNGLRMISFAVMTCSADDLYSSCGYNDGDDIPSDMFHQAFIEQTVGQFNFLTCFGLKDSLRDDVQAAVNFATSENKGELTVRLVSNDL